MKNSLTCQIKKKYSSKYSNPFFQTTSRSCGRVLCGPLRPSALRMQESQRANFEFEIPVIPAKEEVFIVEDMDDEDDLNIRVQVEDEMEEITSED